MKASVNEDCIGCGLCEGTCPDVFSIGDDGVAHAIEGDVPEDAEDCETLGGLIMDVLDRIPSEGESLTLEGKEATAKLTVVRMDRHRIDRVKLVLTPKPKQEEEE